MRRQALVKSKEQCIAPRNTGSCGNLLSLVAMALELVQVTVFAELALVEAE
jgi:hypothetical protein